MKILRAIMLTLLITLCVAGTVAVLLHINSGGGGSGEPQVRERASREEVPDAAVAAPVSTEETDRASWNRALTKPDGSDYWQFYPVISNNVVAGDTVVLSVSAEGFVDWDTDPEFADVEFFDHLTHEGMVYVSFIMPEEPPVIMALYTEIPFDNYDAYIMYPEPQEQGEFAGVAATSSGDAFITLPTAMVRQFYNVNLGEELPSNYFDEINAIVGGVTWDLIDDLPTGLTWAVSPWPLGGQIFGRPQAPQATVVYTVQLRYAQDDTTYEEDGFADPRWKAGDHFLYIFFGLYIAPATDPTFLPDAIPDGMVGTYYDMTFQAYDLPPNETWVWNIEGTRPPGLNLVNEGDMTRSYLRGTPTTSGTYTFTIRFSTSNQDIPDVVRTFTDVQIWDPPTLAPTTLLDGMVSDEDTFYTATLTPSGAVVGETTWTWSISSGSLPGGLKLEPSSTLPNGLISGAPTTATATPTPTFTVKFEANPEDIIGYIEVEYSIKIWARPVITPFNPANPQLPAQLSDGMEDIARPSTSEPDEFELKYEYVEDINVIGLPVGSLWTWSVLPATGALPSGLDFSPAPGAIAQNPFDPPGAETFAHPIELSGIPLPGDQGDYNFVIVVTYNGSNPNMTSAMFSQAYNLKIWPRTYLYISMAGLGNQGFVRRDDPRDPSWEDINGWTPAQGAPYQGRRAVMPGTRAIISTSSGGFVRWEVSPVYDTTQGVSFGTVIEPIKYSTGTSNVRIGGAYPNSAGSGYGINTDFARLGFVYIDMPRTATPPGVATYDGHVYIRGADTRTPVITSEVLKDGTVGGAYTEFLAIESQDVGTGPNMLRWDVVSGDAVVTPSVPVPGLTLDNTAGRTTGIEGVPTISRDTPFRFNVAITLPGTMVIERPYSILINPWDGLGDVDGNGVVDLRDLVLLARVQWDDSLWPLVNMRNARVSTGGEGDHTPGIPDLRFLTRYFQSSQGSLRP